MKLHHFMARLATTQNIGYGIPLNCTLRCVLWWSQAVYHKIVTGMVGRASALSMDHPKTALHRWHLVLTIAQHLTRHYPLHLKESVQGERKAQHKKAHRDTHTVTKGIIITVMQNKANSTKRPKMQRQKSQALLH